jgi:hypothetical protein
MRRVAGFAAPSAPRLCTDLLWEEELARLRADAESLSPAARSAVLAVLDAVAAEAADDDAAETRSLLAALADGRRLAAL